MKVAKLGSSRSHARGERQPAADAEWAALVGNDPDTAKAALEAAFEALGSTVLASVEEGFAVAPSPKEVRVLVVRKDAMRQPLLKRAAGRPHRADRRNRQN